MNEFPYIFALPISGIRFGSFGIPPEFVPRLLWIGKLLIKIGTPNKDQFLDEMSYLSVLLPRYTSLVFEGLV
ncbi:hypothetical protein Mia14_0404 [Candidatus Mancarchaeum acidiphilum]|uniref:Uncharacterized protein n=1 Tax=Candidatus Mancarchaeum acidiphilum TaxID=1920749 RepID=A0A218NMN0_9ARCH|nr:hypothetical protein Mia14_0404 [Candidatus Mancarchaeum acidiphilum]